jgi:AhpD family alkylhydroperoxidase
MVAAARKFDPALRCKAQTGWTAIDLQRSTEMLKIAKILTVSTMLAAGAILSPANADDASYAAAIQDVEQTLGFVPTFLKEMPKAGFPGAWQQLKELEFSEDTALTPKVKALIALAVVSQIPCSYCIWADAASARHAGASDEEVREAVAIAATERFWSTMLNGLQIDLAQFKAEFGPLVGE